MKKLKILISFFLLIFLFSCEKESHNCDCPKQPLGYIPFGIRTLFYPINSTVIPQYISNVDTVSFHLYFSFRDHINIPPAPTGFDYYKYETDNTEFRSESFGLLYYSIAGSEYTQTLSSMAIDWFGVKGIDTTFQRYSILFTLPVDSNEVTQNTFLFDSLLILNKWYTKVLTGPVHKNIQPGLEYNGPVPEQYYYSTEYGIIKLDMSDGTFWEIISE